jgi:beta-lactamase superfamily II metal-dependent hydrolase
MLRFNYKKIFTTVLLVAWIACAFGQAKASKPLVWTMINVNYSPLQGDAHLIETNTGKNILIDAGYLEPAKNALIPFLQSKGIKKLDLVFISHPHKDHYAGLTAIIKSGIKVREVYFNIPDRSICDPEIPWGCDYADILNYHHILKSKSVKVSTAKAGMEFNIGLGTSLKILYAFDGINTPVGQTDINDLSLIMLLKNGSQTALFTGDLNHKIGEYLAKEGRDLKVDILKLPHHGTEGAAPDAFYAAVSPKIAMVPSPALLWCSPRSARMKSWVDSRQIPTYVNGFSGHVTVTMRRDSFQINQERPETRLPMPECPVN